MSGLSLLWGMLVVLTNATTNRLPLKQWIQHIHSPDTAVIGRRHWRESKLFPTQTQNHSPKKRSIYSSIVSTEQHHPGPDVSIPSKVQFIPTRYRVSVTARVGRNPTRHWGRSIYFSLGRILPFAGWRRAVPALSHCSIVTVMQYPSCVFILHAITCKYQLWKHRSPSTSKQIPVHRLLAVYKSTSGL